MSALRPVLKNTGHDEQQETYFGHLAAIVESSDDAIISKSPDGIITTWNKGAEKMFGYASEEAVGKHISLIVPHDYIDEEKKILERIQNNETIDHYETVRNKKNGERFYVSNTVSPLKNLAGEIIGISKIARDITARKSSEAELDRITKELVFQNEEKEKRAGELTIANRELIIANKELAFQNEEKGKRAAELAIANVELAYQNQEKEKRAAELFIANKELGFQVKEKEKRAKELVSTNDDLKFAEERLQSVIQELESFTYSVSHDLRAPLRAIHGYTQMLYSDYQSLFDTEANRLIHNVMNNARKMGQLIDDLLTFSRLGRKELVKMDIPMQDMVMHLCNELQTEQSSRDINFNIKR